MQAQFANSAQDVQALAGLVDGITNRVAVIEAVIAQRVETIETQLTGLRN